MISPLKKLDFEKKAHVLLEESADLTDAEQIEFLHGACKDNQHLLAHCLSILNHQVSDDHFMELVYRDLKTTEKSHDLTGEVIGNYKIEKKIGSGGTAEVFLAFRNDDVHHQPVALKIIRGWGNMHELTERMRRERKILSQFKHANIASFLDGGNADDGRPYFVLEYVQGKPITDYCKNKNLDLKYRLALFVDVCSAVYAAHAKLTLHRDLKPSNILVTDEGLPKLLDFGIAKILNEENNDQMQLTQFFAPMTPQYASPEQLKQEPLSVASDQYSLGVLLYELITDLLPHNAGENKILHLANNESIKPPSERIAEKKDSCKLERRRLIKRLKGDLDAIVMKAISNDPEKRYSSVKELAQDIRRYLQNKTVVAQKSSCWYRTSRLLRRNRKNLLLVGAFACAFLFFVITQQMEIIQERDLALIERAKFEQTQDFLLGLFKLSHPEKNRQKDITVREVLDRGLETIQNKFDSQPTIKIALLSTMARAYQDLELTNIAFELQSESLALQEEFVKTPDETMAITLTSLADLLIEKGGNKQAKKFVQRAIDIYDTLSIKDPLNVADTYSVAGILANRLGEYDSGILFLKRSLEIRQQYLDENDPELVRSYMLLGVVYTGKGDYEQSQEYNKLALATKLMGPDADQVTTSSIHNTIAVVHHFQGEFLEALKHYQKSIDIRVELFGEQSPTLVIPYNNVGEVYTAIAEYDKAIAYHEKSLQILKANDNSELYYLAVTYNRLGDALAGKRQFDVALMHIQKSLEIRKDIYDEKHHDVAKSYDSYGSVYAAMGETQMAMDYYQKALAIRAETYGVDHLLTKETEKNLRKLMLLAQHSFLAG